MELKAKQELTRELTAVKSVGRHTSAGLFYRTAMVHGWGKEGVVGGVEKQGEKN